MKPRLFIAMHYMELGGAEMSLVGLLQALDYGRCDVDLFVYDHRGELMRFIPEGVRLLPENPVYAHLERPLAATLRAAFRFGVLSLGTRWRLLRLVAARLKAKWLYRRYARRHGPRDGSALFGYIGACVTPALPPLAGLGEYDLAISFLTPHNFVRDKVWARRKWAWIHTDYSFIDIDVELERPVWGSFDRIVSISPGVTRAFLQKMPVLAPKVMEMENILSPAFVRCRAEEPCPDAPAPRPGGYNLLSVGRLSHAKNYDNIPDICRRLCEQGLDVRWYIIGYGGEEALIRQRIAEAGMQERVLLLGKRANPYPYIRACDVYVQPSRYEGKSVTVREAQVLCKPVVVAAYATAASQVQDGVDGRIVPQENAACADALAGFLRDAALRERLTKYLEAHDYGNVREVGKLYAALAE